MVKCSECAMLCVRQRVNREIAPATSEYRKTLVNPVENAFYRYDEKPECYCNVDEFASDCQKASNREQVLLVLNSERNCKSFVVRRNESGPLEHINMEWRESIAIEEARWQKWREDQSAAMMEMYAEIKNREAEREAARDAREAQRDAREAQREIELDNREDERQMRFERNERSRFWQSIVWSVGVAGAIGILSSVIGGVVERGYVFEKPKNPAVQQAPELTPEPPKVPLAP